jgi:hypothetical protein
MIQMTGAPGKDTFDCGHGPDLVTDYNPSEDTLIDCENALADTIGPTVYCYHQRVVHLQRLNW